MGSLSSRFLFLSLVLFLLSGTAIFLGVEWGSRKVLLLGVGAQVAAVGGFIVAVRLRRRKRDPLERRTEQRLWKSGPLGRKWLAGRRRIP